MRFKDSIVKVNARFLPDYDILGKSGASPTAIATAGSAADIITGGVGNTIGKFVR